MRQDKSIRDTAIITITLIGGLFLLQRCSNEGNIRDKIEMKNVLNTNKSLDSQTLLYDEYKTRDSEIPLASYKAVPKDKKNIDSNITHTITIDKNSSKIIKTINVVISNREVNTTKVKDMPKLVKVPSIDKNITKVKDVPTKVVIVPSIDKNVSKVAFNKSINPLPAVIKKDNTKKTVIPTATTAIPTPISIQDIKVPSVNVNMPKVPKAIDMEKEELKRALKEREHRLTILKNRISQFTTRDKELKLEVQNSSKVINKLEERLNSALVDGNDLKENIAKLKSKLAYNRARREKALNDKAELNLKLNLALKENEALKSSSIDKKSKIEELESKILKMVKVIKSGNSRVLEKYNQTIEKLEIEKENLEESLAKETQQEKNLINQREKLNSKIEDLNSTISKMLVVANTEKTSDNKTLKLFQIQKDALEKDLAKNISEINRITREKNQLTNQVIELKSAISKIVSLLKRENQKVLAKHNELIKNFKDEKENLEKKLSKEVEIEKSLNIDKSRLNSRVKELEDTIVKMLNSVKTGNSKALEKYNKNIQTLITTQNKFKESLAKELEKEKAILNEKFKLESNLKAKSNENIELHNKIENLQATIAKMLTIIKDKTKEAEEHYKKDIQLFKAKEESLEQNLTKELEKEKALANEKAKLEAMVKSLEENLTTKDSEKIELNSRIEKLKATVVKMLTIAKDKTKEAEEHYKRDIQSFKAKEESLEQNLTQELEKERALANEKAKLEDMVKSLEANLTAKESEKIELNSRIENLKATVVKMLTITKDKTKEVKEHYKRDMQLFKAKTDSLEQNLTQELEKERALINERDRLKDTVKSLEDNLTITLYKIRESKASVNKLINDIKHRDKKIEELNALSSNYKALEENLTKELEKEKVLANEKAKLEENLTEILSKTKEEEEQIAKLINDIKQKDKKLEELNALSSNYQALEQNLTAQMEEKEAIANEKAKLEDMVKSLEANLTETSSKTKEKEEQIAKLLNDIKQKDTKLEELNALSSNYQALEQNLTAQMEEKEAIANEKAKLEDMIKSLEDNLTTISSETKEKEEKIAKLLNDIKQRDKRLEELNTLSSNYQALEQNLTAQMEEKEAIANEKAKLEDIVKSLEDNLTETSSKIKEKEEQIAKLLNDIKQKDTKLEELNAISSNYKALEENLTKELKEKRRLEELLKDREAKINSIKEKEKQALFRKEAKDKLTKAFSLTDVKFENGSATLTKESKDRLDKTAEVIKEYSNFRYAIHGHTDNRGNENYNIKLSARRAEAVKAYLVSKGVSADILDTKGVGSAEPIADNKTKEGRSKNRRVEFIILK